MKMIPFNEDGAVTQEDVTLDIERTITVTIDRADAEVFAGGMDYIIAVSEGKAPVREGAIKRIRQVVADALASRPPRDAP